MLSAIQNRRAVRKYLPDKVKDKDVQQLIDAFEAAPCGMGKNEVMQGIVVENPQLLDKVEKATNNACYGAPFMFVIATQKGSPFEERNASAAAENIMVQATDLGYGSVYIMGGALTLNKDTDLLKELGVKDGYEVPVIVPVGKAAQAPEQTDRSHRYELTRK